MPLEVPNRYLACAPLVVSAPTTRCGTTLVQRLLTSADNAFIYGEEIAQNVATLTGILVGLMAQFEKAGAAHDADFRRALEGTLTDWRPGLIPPTQVMLRAWVETYYQLPMALTEYGASIGRPLWGFKRPTTGRDMLRAWLMLMPRTRVVYVFRHLADTLASAKARRFVTTDAAVAEFCALWALNLRQTLELRDDARLMLLRYEELVERPGETLPRIEAFTGAVGLKAREFGVKVNTFAGEEASGHSPTQYIAPAALTDADHAAIAAHAGDLMTELYGPDALARGGA